MMQTHLARLMILLSIAASLALVSCVDADNARPYDAFVADYQRALNPDLGAFDDMGAPDAPVDLPPDMPPPDMPPADMAQQQCSGAAGTPINVTFVNQTGRAGRMVWVDSQCIPRPYARVGAGSSVAQGTFTRHVWRLVDETAGQTLGEVTVTQQQTTYIFE